MKINNPVIFYGAITLVFVVVGIKNVYKPLPANIHYESPVYAIPATSIDFWSDQTYPDASKGRVSEQEIFDNIFERIKNAHSYVLVDMFFFSDFTGVETDSYRELSRELTEVLIAKKQSSPETVIQVITDPINMMYGGHPAAHFAALRSAGIPVIITDVRPLRDSNPIYSAVWRVLFQWWGNTDTAGWLPNPLDADSPHLSTRTYLAMLNYKANHRKVVVTDTMVEGVHTYETVIASANPHDGSSAHSNSAISLKNGIALDVIKSESAVAALSGVDFVLPKDMPTVPEPAADNSVLVQLLTEGAIKDAALEQINGTVAGDAIDIAMFYFADRDIIKSLLAADARGVSIRLLLDPNKDAFGRTKDGSPNRQVAHELMTKSTGSTTIRWCNTQGEQCHSKLLLIGRGDNRTILHGSANYTRRNLDDLNLEASILLLGSSSQAVFQEAQEYFDAQWENRNGIAYSVPYETYTTTSRYKYWMYRLKEWSGLSRW